MARTLEVRPTQQQILRAQEILAISRDSMEKRRRATTLFEAKELQDAGLLRVLTVL